MNPYFFYLSLIDILSKFVCKTNQQRAILSALREMMICIDIEEWAMLSNQQRVTWVLKHMPTDVLLSIRQPDQRAV